MGVSFIFRKSTKIAQKKLTPWFLTMFLTSNCKNNQIKFDPHTKYSGKSVTFRDYMTISWKVNFNFNIVVL